VRAFPAIIIAVAVLAGLIFMQPSRTMEPMNSLFVIAPYKYEGLWVFDDPAVALSGRAIHCQNRQDDRQGDREHSKLEWRREDHASRLYFHRGTAQHFPSNSCVSF